MAVIKPGPNPDQIVKDKPQLPRAPKVTPKEACAVAKEAPSPMNYALQQH